MSASKYWKLKHFAAAAIATGANRHEASKACGVDQATLFRWLKKEDFLKAIEQAKERGEAGKPEPIQAEPRKVKRELSPEAKKATRAFHKRLQVVYSIDIKEQMKDPRHVLYWEMLCNTDRELARLLQLTYS